MSIAQRFVAGEGELHLEDRDALSAFHAESVNLPWVIFRAAFRATRTEQLPQRARAVLAALARTVDASKPYAAIYARRELLTGRAMLSMRTFYRSLDDLEAAGLVERRAQSRYVEAGLFGRSYLHLTERAAILLGLVETTIPELSQTKSSHDATSSLTSNPSFTPPSATVADGAIHRNLYPASSQKRQPGQVPADLQRLRTLGFLDFLIFKLMREARDHGKRLSDVVEVTWQHLKTARAPINYLRALLRNPVDFAHQLRTKVHEHQQAEKQSHEQRDADEVITQCAGKVFVEAGGKRTYTLSADGQALTVFDSSEGVHRQAVNWQLGFAKALKSGKLQVAKEPALQHEETPKPTVATKARNHLAELRNLLRPRSRADISGNA